MVSTQLLIHHLGVQHTIHDGHHDRGDILMKYTKDNVPPSETLHETNSRQIFVWQEVDFKGQNSPNQ